jgi:mono/diheme cytochrome c family protein
MTSLFYFLPGGFPQIFRPSCLLMILLLSGCRQGMYNQPKAKPLRKNNLFLDQSSARPIPPNTVARGDLQLNDAFYTGKIADRLIDFIPIQITEENLMRGKERFNIYCSVCHGQTGEGNGMIVQRGFPPPPTFHSERLRSVPNGHIYDVITHGYGVMYSYASRINPNDRWCIVAYLRVLQLSHNVSIKDLSSEEQKELDKL